MDDRFKEQLEERTMGLSDTAPLKRPQERATGELAPAEPTILAGPEKTQMGASVTCPVCKTQNAPGEVWCAECGFRLGSTPEEAVAEDLTGVLAVLTDLRGNSYPLEAGKNTVGRLNTSVLLNHASVSRRHAQVVLENGQAWLEDLGSSNGTYLGGERLHPFEKRPIEDGMEARFGGLALTLRLNPGDRLNREANSNVTQALPADSVLAQAHSGIGPPLRKEEEEEAPRLVLPTGQVFFIREGVNRIGRRDSNDIVLPDSFTSGYHADVIREGMSVMVVDQNSTNGTLLNALRVLPLQRTLMENGDHITFGKTALKYVWPQHLVSDAPPGEEASDAERKS
jgi:pSer/pThr/pTyr-binding forkhead associated (FHA) protein